MLWAVVMLSLLPAAHCVQCMSSSGKPVDWFIVYKLPLLPGSKSPILKHGYGHLYMDVDNPTWQLSKLSMNNSNHAVPYTLQPIYESKKSDDFMYLMYNDEDPQKHEPRSDGHSKGVLAFDKTSGFWMVHSTPRFPPFQTKGYTWPVTALRNGQTFLCVSYSYSRLDSISRQIMYNYVQVYDKWVPQSFRTDNPNLQKVITHFHLRSSPWTSEVKLTSIQGTQFTSFAKTAEFGEDLYEDLVAPSLRSDLLTETWMIGGGAKLKSNCSRTYKVYNVMEIAFTNIPEEVTFKDTKDHSKWAVSKAAGNSWVCVGDINRQVHQEHRGGGTVCMQNAKVWQQFFNSVQTFQKC